MSVLISSSIIILTAKFRKFIIIDGRRKDNSERKGVFEVCQMRIRFVFTSVQRTRVTARTVQQLVKHFSKHEQVYGLEKRA